MRVNFVSKQIAVTDGIRDYVEKKMQRIEKFFDSSANLDITVTFTVQKTTQTAEILVKANKLYIKGLGKSEDLYASLDFAIDKLERQIVKYKDRLNDRKQNAGTGGSLRMNVYAADSVQEKTPKILVTKEFSGDPMDVEEAVMQMELLNKEFFAFRNNAGQLNVVYRRDDGDIGLIEA